jgi:hypothetical protein
MLHNTVKPMFGLKRSEISSSVVVLGFYRSRLLTFSTVIRFCLLGRYPKELNRLLRGFLPVGCLDSSEMLSAMRRPRQRFQNGQRKAPDLWGEIGGDEASDVYSNY